MIPESFREIFRDLFCENLWEKDAVLCLEKGNATQKYIKFSDICIN